MSEWLIAGLKIGFLVLLWLFVLLIASTIRTDLFGKAATAGGPAIVSEPTRTPQPERRALSALRILDGRQAGLEIPINGYVDIGRAAESRLVLDDDYCSTHHATIRPDDRGGCYIEDFGSTNGTFVNDARISAPTALGPDDVIRIGRTSMKLVR